MGALFKTLISSLKKVFMRSSVEPCDFLERILRELMGIANG